MKKLKTTVLVAITAVTALFVSCTKTVTEPGSTTTLTTDPYTGTAFDNEGSYAGMDSLNTSFVANILADNNVNTAFIGAFNSIPTASSNNKQNFISSMYNFLVTVCGGPNIYVGPSYLPGSNMAQSMKKVHSGMNISASQFSSIATDLANAMHSRKWSKADSTTIMTAVGSLSSDVENQ